MKVLQMFNVMTVESSPRAIMDESPPAQAIKGESSR